VDYLLRLGRAGDRRLVCAVCGTTPAPHLLEARPDAGGAPERDRALCDVHAAGLQEDSGVSEDDLRRLRHGDAPESWR
jgi:hypothetical protein